MLYDAYIKWNDTSDSFWLSVILGATAIFMYFFRSNFAKKLINRDSKPKP